MDSVPRWYYRGLSFNTKYQKFLDNYSENDLYLNIYNLTGTYRFYWQFLKDLLKEKGIYLYLPKEIFKKAKLLDIVEDTEIWLEFIDDCNKLFFENNSKAMQLQQLYILKKYTKRLIYPHEFINKTIKQANINLNYKEKELSQTLHIYNQNDFGMDLYTFKSLYAYFINHTEIKKVWLYGSRAQNKARPHSDIDLLIQSPESSFENILTTLDELKIPNYIDAKNLYEIKASKDYPLFYFQVLLSRPILIYTK